MRYIQNQSDSWHREPPLATRAHSGIRALVRSRDQSATSLAPVGAVRPPLRWLMLLLVGAEVLLVVVVGLVVVLVVLWEYIVGDGNTCGACGACGADERHITAISTLYRRSQHRAHHSHRQPATLSSAQQPLYIRHHRIPQHRHRYASFCSTHAHQYLPPPQPQPSPRCRY